MSKVFNKSNFNIKMLFFLIAIFLILIPIFEIQATNPALQEAQKGLLQTASPDGAGLTDKTVQDFDQINSKTEVTNIITRIVGYALSFLGVIFLILIIISGYQWMTAGGNEEVISKAKKRIINSVIGLAIVLMAYVLVQTIFDTIIKATSQEQAS